MENVNRRPLEQTQPLNQTPQSYIRNEKGIRPIILGLILLVFIVGVGAFYLGIKQNTSSSKTTNNHQGVSPTPQQQNADTGQVSDWKTYEAKSSGYSLKYRSDWKQETPKGSGCGPLFFPEDKSKTYLIRVCGHYRNPSNTPDQLAAQGSQNIDKFLLQQPGITVDGHFGIRHEVQLRNGDQEIHVYIANVQYTDTEYQPDNTLQKYGTLVIDLEMRDKTQFEEAKKHFDEILATFKLASNNQVKQTNDPTLSQEYTSLSKRISFKFYQDWKVRPERPYDTGSIIEIQGPKQLLLIIEGADANYGFDGFKIENTSAIIAGKSYPARKFTSQSFDGSFIDIKVHETPYKLYVQYGDAASVGFRGYNQQYEEKVNFTTDIVPILKILETLKY